ncbi:hypothetical protein PUR29_34760 [Methylobacterium ajmalii]|uniref:Uncharacterized protein n=1 Tax=Methylobacterium ajmalii TaxID=2738439 RepID=A0ABV0A5D4_9HYPH
MDKGLMPQEIGGDPDGSDNAFDGFPLGGMVTELFGSPMPQRDSGLVRQRREVVATLSNAAENLSIATALLARMAQDEFFPG